MVFECKRIGAIFLVLVDLHRDKSTKVKKKNLRTSLFVIRDKCAPKHQRPNALVPFAALNINLLADIRQSIGSFSLRFPRPSPVNKHLKMSDLGLTLGDLSPDFGSVYLGRSTSVHNGEPSD